jgi:hypothetical protein
VHCVDRLPNRWCGCLGLPRRARPVLRRMTIRLSAFSFPPAAPLRPRPRPGPIGPSKTSPASAATVTSQGDRTFHPAARPVVDPRTRARHDPARARAGSEPHGPRRARARSHEFGPRFTGSLRPRRGAATGPGDSEMAVGRPPAGLSLCRLEGQAGLQSTVLPPLVACSAPRIARAPLRLPGSIPGGRAGLLPHSDSSADRVHLISPARPVHPARCDLATKTTLAAVLVLAPTVKGVTRRVAAACGGGAGRPPPARPGGRTVRVALQGQRSPRLRGRAGPGLASESRPRTGRLGTGFNSESPRWTGLRVGPSASGSAGPADRASRTRVGRLELGPPRSLARTHWHEGP